MNDTNGWKSFSNFLDEDAHRFSLGDLVYRKSYEKDTQSSLVNSKKIGIIVGLDDGSKGWITMAKVLWDYSTVDIEEVATIYLHRISSNENETPPL